MRRPVSSPDESRQQAPGAEPPFRLTRIMGVSHGEFFRLLPRAVQNAPVAQQGDQEVVVETAQGRVAIALGAESARKLGMLELSETEITMEFIGFTAAARRAFLARFDLAFQKRGG